MTAFHSVIQNYLPYSKHLFPGQQVKQVHPHICNGKSNTLTSYRIGVVAVNKDRFYSFAPAEVSLITDFGDLTFPSLITIPSANKGLITSVKN